MSQTDAERSAAEMKKYLAERQVSIDADRAKAKAKKEKSNDTQANR